MTIINKIQNLPWNKRSVNQITQIVVHHSASEYDNQSNQARFEALRKGHLENGWYGLSYHFVIFKDGEIWQCNNFSDASPTDGINYPSLGILVDGFFHDNKDKPTIEQLKSLDYLLGDLCNNHPEFPAVRADVKAHREVNATVCCGDDLFKYVKEWRDTGKLAILDCNVPEDTTPDVDTLKNKVFNSIKQLEKDYPNQYDNWGRANGNTNESSNGKEDLVWIKEMIDQTNWRHEAEVKKLKEQNSGLAKSLTDSNHEYVIALDGKAKAEELTRQQNTILRDLESQIKNLKERKEELLTTVDKHSSELKTLNSVLDDKQKIVIKQGDLLNKNPTPWSWTEFIKGLVRRGILPSLAGLSVFLIAIISSPEFLSVVNQSKGLTLLIPMLPLIIEYLKTFNPKP